MKSESIAGLRLYYESREQACGDLIGSSIRKSTDLINVLWGLEPPGNCRVYVMTSWPKFLFHSAPWAWKFFLGLGFPFYALRFHIIWPFAGGWTITTGKRISVGIKPPRLMQKVVKPSDTLYLPYRDVNEKVEAIACHELVHAFSAHLNLPGWLNEGLATYAVDCYLGRQTLRPETLKDLSPDSPNYVASSLQGSSMENPRALLFQYKCGYWQTRYIEESRPGLLRSIFSRRPGRKELERDIAVNFGKDPDTFWKEINDEVQFWFDKKEVVLAGACP